MLEYQACGCQKKAGEESVKGKRFVQMPINYLRSPPSKGELAIKWLHNIGTSHTVETFNFNRKMVCHDHVTVDMEHRLPGLSERRLLNEATVPTEFVQRKNEKFGTEAKGRCCTRRRVSLKGRI